MKFRELSIAGAFEVTPQLHGDPRGLFTEWYRFDRLAEVVGHPLNLAQANLSVSAAGVVRGVHFADVPRGQAKYITCVRGAALDVVVDLRVGSPPSVSGKASSSTTWTAARSTSPRASATASAR